MSRLAALLFSGLAAASIASQQFSNADCTGDTVSIVRPDIGANLDSSGCVAASATFQSVKNIQNDNDGFACLQYTDTQCQTPAAAFGVLSFVPEGVEPCVIITGQSTKCFNQALQFNPFAEATALMQVGESQVQMDNPGQNVFLGALGSCQSNGCDPTKKFTSSFDFFSKTGTLTVSMNGFFNGTNERNYMVQLLDKALHAAQGPDATDLSGSSEDNNIIHSYPSFARVTMQDSNSAATLAQMDITAENAPSGSGSCDGGVESAIETALGLVPDVGGIIAAVFHAECGLGS